MTTEQGLSIINRTAREDRNERARIALEIDLLERAQRREEAHPFWALIILGMSALTWVVTGMVIFGFVEVYQYTTTMF